MKQSKPNSIDRSRKLKDVLGAPPRITNTGILSAKPGRGNYSMQKLPPKWGKK